MKLTNRRGSPRYTIGTAVTCASAESSLPSPPTGDTIGWLDATWNPDATDGTFDTNSPWDATRSVKELLLEITGAGAATLTAAELYAVVLESVTLADDDVDTVDFASNELDITSHAYLTGDGPVQLTTSNTLPAGLELETDYYVIYVGSGTISLATSRENAFAGTAVAFTDGGTGTHTVVDVAGETERCKFLSYGQLGDDVSGTLTVTLTAQGGWTQSYRHTPRAIGYAVAGTLSASTATVRIYPLYEVNS